MASVFSEINDKFNKCYHDAKNRCNNKFFKNYKYYGGNGIRFLWNSFEEFSGDMYYSFINHVGDYGMNDTTLDRVDNNGNYCFDNCVWSTKLQQQNNTSNTKRYLYDGFMYTLTDLEQLTLLSRDCLRYRLDYLGLQVKDLFR